MNHRRWSEWWGWEPVDGGLKSLRGTLGSSLRSPAEGEVNEGFPPPPDKDLESPSSTRGRPQTTSTRLYAGGELQGSPAWQALSGHKRRIPLAVVLPRPGRGAGTLIPSAQRFVWAPSIRVFSDESVLHISWPKYWNFSFSISPSNEHLGLISFRIDWLDLLAIQGTLKRLLQHYSSKLTGTLILSLPQVGNTDGVPIT